MKGLDRSRALFEDHVMPKIREELPEVIPLLAAGLVGEGSECFGYDDEISLDHDSETRICLWLDEEHFFQYEGLLRRILENLSMELSGRTSLLQGWRSGVFEIGRFYEQLIRVPDRPASNKAWLEIDETSLAAAVNGEVFLDTYGAFTKIRNKLLEYYPQDVFLFKLARESAVCAQTGQYNYIRAVKRKDFVTASMIREAFIDHFTRAVFLLNRTYRPYYKWAYQALSALFRDPVILCSDPAAVPTAAQDALRHGSNLRIRIQVGPVGGPGSYGPVIVQGDCIGIAQAGGGFTAAAQGGRLVPVPALAFTLAGGAAAVVVRIRFRRRGFATAGRRFTVRPGGCPRTAVFSQYGKGGFRLRCDTADVCQMHRQHDTGRNQNQDGDDHQGHTPAKPSDHFSSSSE